MAELKPCPFCGYDKISIQSRNRETWRSGGGEYAYYKTFSVRCRRCGARGPTVGALCDVTEKNVLRYGKEEKVKSYKQLKDEAAEAWNRRADLPEPPKEDENE